MINFRVNKTNEHWGSLNFQLLYRYDESQSIDHPLDSLNYENSIAIEEDAFVLVEALFNFEKIPYYHWGFHEHGKSYVEKVIENLEKLKIRLISSKEDFSYLEVYNSPEINSFIRTNIKSDTFLNKIIVFIEDIIVFLKNSIEKYYGIFLLGI